MNKILLLLSLIILATTACRKENEIKTVTYFIKGFGEPYKVVYCYGKNSKTITENIQPLGIDDTWSYTFSGLPGEITYLYIESKEDISNSMHFMASILIDGKSFQSARAYDKANISANDTLYTIKRSGTIPF